MNILVFSPYYPPHTGGLESHSEEFNRHLSKKGVRITVFTPLLPIGSNTKESLENITVIRYPAFEIIPNFPVPKFWSPSFWRSFSSLFHPGFTVVISRTRFFLSSLLALIFAKLKKIPLVHIEHGSDFVQLSSSWKTLLAKLYDYTFGKLIFRCSTLNISISEAVQNFVKTFDTRHSPIIYRGIDFSSLDTLSPDLSLKEKYPEKIILTTAARLYKWKGIEHTIAAIRDLPDDFRKKIIFLIIGDGEDFNHLKSLSHGLPIEMLGNLKREAVISILKASDIYIHSSFPGGGLSTSLLEAMDSKCAVVATENEGAREVIHDNRTGLIVGAPNGVLLQEKIQLLILDSSKRHSLGETARQEIRERFSWDKSIERYLEILRSL